MKNSTKIGMAIIAAASILGAAYVYAFTGVVEEKAILAGAVPASRAAADGVVKEVKVVKGQSLNKQDVVAVIEYR